MSGAITIRNHGRGVRALPVSVDGDSGIVNLHPGDNDLSEDVGEAILRDPSYQALFEGPKPALENVTPAEDAEGEDRGEGPEFVREDLAPMALPGEVAEPEDDEDGAELRLDED